MECAAARSTRAAEGETGLTAPAGGAFDGSFDLHDSDPGAPDPRQLGAKRGTDVGNVEAGDRRPRRRVREQGEGIPGQPGGADVRNGIPAEDAMNDTLHPYQDARLGGERAGRSRPAKDRSNPAGRRGLNWRGRLPHWECALP